MAFCNQGLHPKPLSQRSSSDLSDGRARVRSRYEPLYTACPIFNIGRSVKLVPKLIRVAVVGLGWRSTGLAFQSCTAGIMSCGHLLDYEALFN